MDELEERICKIRRRSCRCPCGNRTPCRFVCDVVEVVLQKCGEEHEDEDHKGRVNPSKSPGLGIPGFNQVEKLTEVIPVKVQPSLKKVIPKPQSAWIRNLIIKALERMKEEQS